MPRIPGVVWLVMLLGPGEWGVCYVSFSRRDANAERRWHLDAGAKKSQVRVVKFGAMPVKGGPVTLTAEDARYC